MRDRATRLSVLIWYGFALFSTATTSGGDELVLTNIGQVRALSPADIARHPRVHLQGDVLDQRLGEHIVVGDGTGTLFAETRLTLKLNPRERVELWGTPVWDGTRVHLENAAFRLVASSVPSAKQTPRPPVKPAELPVLTKAWQIRDLTAETAAWQYPVRLRGVVTFYAKDKRLTVQDDISGIRAFLQMM